MKRVTIHQPDYLPWCGFFNKMKRTDIFIIFDTAQFNKGVFQHRNRIKTNSRAGWTYLTQSVQKKLAPINTIEFIDETWKRKHLEMIIQYYCKSDYFDCYINFFRQYYINNIKKLSEFNIEIIKYITKCLNIETEILFASDLDIDYSIFHGTDVNLEMLNAVGASYYLSGKAGIDYLDASKFKSANIELEFQDYVQKRYKQLYREFIPNLSIIDLLFNEGDKSKNYI